VKLDPRTVADLALAFRPQSYLRIMPAAHTATPLGMGFGHTRFSSPDQSFRLVSIARDLATAIAETIVRDSFEGATERVLDYSEIEEWAVAEVTTPSLQVLDLRTTGLLRLGVSTDAARAKSTSRRASISARRSTEPSRSTALLYSSRLNSAECLAVYDRALDVKLVSSSAVHLVRHPDLHALNSIGVTIRRAP
jgi:hypothetical protein